MKITRSIKININTDSDNLILNLKKELNKLDFSTDIGPNSICFKKIYRSTTDTGKNKLEAFKILKHGKMELSKFNKGILITYILNINHLLFFSLLFTMVSIFILGFSNHISWINSVLAGLLIGLLIFALGFYNMKNKIINLIKNISYSTLSKSKGNCENRKL